MTEKTINYIKLPDGETYKIGGSGSGFNLFDTKVSDHILEGDEALGWALQGTYVYKEGVAGSRTGYADFYNRCLEEYNEAEYENILSSWQQPVLTSNTSSTLLTFSDPHLSGGFISADETTWGTNAMTNFSNIYLSMDSTTTNYFNLNAVPNATTVFDIEFSDTLSLNSMNILGAIIPGYATGLHYTKIFDISNEEYPVLIASILGDTPEIIFKNVITNKIRVCLFVATDGASYPTRITNISIKAQKVMLVGKKNSNGHRFYDISQKPYIDSIYETTGIADYYGIDTENERIFLPRNKYFAVTGGVMGNGMTLGLTDGTRNLGIISLANQAVDNVFGAVNTYGQPVGTLRVNSDFGSDRSLGVTTDPTKSGITLEPNENKYLYICVGNTKVESAITNVTEITTSENDTLPLFYNFYSNEDMTTTGAYVNASLGSWLSGNVYTTAYNELVNKLGTDNVKANTDTYTDYDFVVNQDNMTFRLPIKNGQEIMFATGVKGNGISLGLTDGTQDLGVFVSSSGNGIGAFEGTATVGTSASSVTGANNLGKVIGITTDSTKSGIELDTENITIPDGWNLYYKVANAVTNLELLDVAKVTADLNTKLSRDNKEEIIAWGIPDYTAGISYATTGNISFIAPVKGYFSLNLMGTGGQVTINGNDIGALKYVTGYSLFPNLIPLDKNDVLAISGNTTINGGCYFFPMKGAN